MSNFDKHQQFHELAMLRRSIRQYEDKPIPKEILDAILETSRTTPSAGNCQPWHIFVIESKEKREELVPHAWNQKFIASAPVALVICADINRTIERYKERGRDLYCLQDTAAMIQTIMFSASALGLGTCWIGAFDEEKVAEALGLAPEMRPIAILPMGYPAADPPVWRRREVEEFVTYV